MRRYFSATGSKPFLSVLFCLFLTVSAIAQQPGSLKLAGSAGFAQPPYAGVSGGYLLALEPKIIVTPTIDVGVRIEAAQLTRSVISDGSTFTTNSRFLSSCIITGNYWLSKGRFRSFVGLGAGLYHIPATDRVIVVHNQSPDDILFPVIDRLGGMVRYGLKVGHYIASVEYNLVTPSTVYRSVTPLSSPNSYLSIKVGYEIGGYKARPAPKK